MTTPRQAIHTRPHSMGAEWHAHLLWAGTLTAMGLTWLLVTGPLPVVRGTTATDMDVPLGYMIAAFPFLGILLADIAEQLRNPAHRGRGLVLLTQTVFICLLSALRLKYRLPISGHLLLMTFFLLHSLGFPHSRLRSGETSIGVLVLALLLGVKLVAWNDWLTPAVALAIAGLICAIGKLCEPLADTSASIG